MGSLATLGTTSTSAMSGKPIKQRLRLDRGALEEALQPRAHQHIAELRQRLGAEHHPVTPTSGQTGQTANVLLREGYEPGNIVPA